MVIDFSTDMSLNEFREYVYSITDWSDVYIPLLHITTSLCECHDIADKGLIPIKDVLQDCQRGLGEFLLNNDVRIDYRKREVVIGSYKVSFDSCPILQSVLYRKVYTLPIYDKEYGELNYCPEIITELGNRFGGKGMEIKKKYVSIAKPYKVSLCVPTGLINKTESRIDYWEKGTGEKGIPGFLYLLKRFLFEKRGGLEVVFDTIPREYIVGIERI